MLTKNGDPQKPSITRQTRDPRGTRKPGRVISPVMKWRVRNELGSMALSYLWYGYL